jgi:hypothetical protein
MKMIEPPEGYDLEQYIASEVLREQVEGKFLQAYAANQFLRKGLGLKFDVFNENGKE